MTALVKVRDLKMHFPLTRGALFKRGSSVVRAVDGVSFDLVEGETLSLVGESGCGKSTMARAILQLHRPTSGQVFYKDTDLTKLKAEALRRARRHMQMIFQDPYASLNPRMTVAETIAEPILVHKLGRGEQVRNRVEELLGTVGLSAALMNRYPHEFSGGQRQRIGIARALAANPEFIICDEAIASLDVSIQAQIINLLEELQQKFNLTYLFIAHDLAVVKHISMRVAAMYAGKIVELADCDKLYSTPRHPYTRALLSAVPVPDPKLARSRQTTSSVTDLSNLGLPLEGCRFSNRCPLATDQCRHSEPVLTEVVAGHQVACFHAA